MHLTARPSQPALAIAVAAILGVFISGCAEQPTYASLPDASLNAAFPTEAEITSTLGAMKSIDDPEFVPAISPTLSPQPKSPNVSQGCYEVMTLTPELRAKRPDPVRALLQVARPESSSSDSKIWILNQFNSTDEAGKYLSFQEGRYKGCELYSTYDAAGDAQVAVVAKKDKGASASIMIHKGDVVMSFTTNGTSEDQVKKQAATMVPILTRHLNDLAPKN